MTTIESSWYRKIDKQIKDTCDISMILDDVLEYTLNLENNIKMRKGIFNENIIIKLYFNNFIFREIIKVLKDNKDYIASVYYDSNLLSIIMNTNFEDLIGNYNEDKYLDYRSIAILSKTDRVVLSKEEEEKLIIRIKNGDEKAKELLYLSMLRIILNIVRSYDQDYISQLELVSIGIRAVDSAIKSYKIQNAKFSTYAFIIVKKRIETAIQRAKHKKNVNVEYITDLYNKDDNIDELSMLEEIKPIKQISFEDDIIKQEQRKELINAVKSILPEEDFNILALSIGLEDNEKITNKAIGDQHNVTRQAMHAKLKRIYRVLSRTINPYFFYDGFDKNYYLQMIENEDETIKKMSLVNFYEQVTEIYNRFSIEEIERALKATNSYDEGKKILNDILSSPYITRNKLIPYRKFLTEFLIKLEVIFKDKKQITSDISKKITKNKKIY